MMPATIQPTTLMELRTCLATHSSRVRADTVEFQTLIVVRPVFQRLRGDRLRTHQDAGVHRRFEIRNQLVDIAPYFGNSPRACRWHQKGIRRSREAEGFVGAIAGAEGG